MKYVFIDFIRKHAISEMRGKEVKLRGANN